MNITILCLGSRGDLQPYLALAVGLQQAGHRATLAVPASAAAWVQRYGVAVAPVRFDIQAFLQQPRIQAVLNGRNVFRQLQLMRGEMQAGLQQVMSDFWEAGQSADCVVASSFGYGADEVARQRGLPLAYALLAPFVPATRAFPTFMLPLRFSLGGGYNRLTYPLMLRAGWSAFAGPLNAWRAAELGLPPWRSIDQLLGAQQELGAAWLYGFSPSVLPKPPDWPDQHHVTGYWFLEPTPTWQPATDLLRFLDGGPPPVYVGFGSMRPADPEGQAHLVARALDLSGHRGVLLTGALTRGHAAPNMFYVDDVPHAWLFPRMAAVVHHGGAGTTGAGLRAGVPSLVRPFIGDQFAWAGQVVNLGVGRQVAGGKKMTAEALAQAIDAAVHDATLRSRAAALGEKIRAEFGVEMAVGLIERHAAVFKQRRLQPAGGVHGQAS